MEGFYSKKLSLILWCLFIVYINNIYTNNVSAVDSNDTLQNNKTFASSDIQSLSQNLTQLQNKGFNLLPTQEADEDLNNMINNVRQPTTKDILIMNNYTNNLDKNNIIASSQEKPKFFKPYGELIYRTYFSRDIDGTSNLYNTKTAVLPTIMPMFGAGIGAVIGEHFGLHLRGYGSSFFASGINGSFGIIDLSFEYILGREVFGKYGDKNKLIFSLGPSFYMGSMIADDSASIPTALLLNLNTITVTDNHGSSTIFQDSGSVSQTYISGYNQNYSYYFSGGSDVGNWCTWNAGCLYSTEQNNFSNTFGPNGQNGSGWGSWGNLSNDGSTGGITVTGVSSSGSPLLPIGTTITQHNLFNNINLSGYSTSYSGTISYWDDYYPDRPGPANHVATSTWTPIFTTTTQTQNFGPQYAKYLNQYYTITYTHTDINGTVVNTQQTVTQTFSAPTYTIMTGTDSHGNVLGSGGGVTATGGLLSNGDFVNNTNVNYQVGGGNVAGAITDAQNVLLFAVQNHWTSAQFSSSFASTNSGVYGITTNTGVTTSWDPTWQNNGSTTITIPQSYGPDYTTTYTPDYYNGGHLVSSVLSNNGNTTSLTFEHEAYVNYQGHAYLIGVQEQYDVTSNFGTIMSNFNADIAAYALQNQQLVGQMAMLARSQYNTGTGGVKLGTGYTHIIHKHLGMRIDIDYTAFFTQSNAIVSMIGCSAGLQVYF